MNNQSIRILIRSSFGLLCGILSATAANAQLILRPMPELRAQSQQSQSARVSNTVIGERQPVAVIRPDITVQQAVQSLSIRRTSTLDSIRAQPVMRLERADLDFTPLLQNSRAPFNIAQSLRAMPQLAQVREDNTSFHEIDQGMLVHSVLTYRLAFGSCNNQRQRAQIETTGIACGTRTATQPYVAQPRSDQTRSDQTRTDQPQIGRSRDASPILEGILKAVVPGLRLPARANAGTSPNTAGSATHPSPADMRGKIAPHLAKLRTALGNPAQRAQIETEIGSENTARLATLGDDELAQELADYGETRIEEVMFVPKADVLDADIMTRTALSHQPMRMQSRMPALTSVVRQPVAGRQPQQLPPGGIVFSNTNGLDIINALNSPPRDLPSKIFVTGFTIGRQYEWKQEISKTINWCVVIDCSETYFVGASANFSFGIGLRFPIRLDGQYRYSNGKASLRTTFVPINGSPADYSSAGMSSTELNNGKELVAEFFASGRAGYKLPGSGVNIIVPPIGKDFTEDLDAPYTLGQFTPPAPGGPGMQPLEKTFEDIDLLAARADFKIAGAVVNPAVQITLVSDALRFKLTDLGNNKETMLNTSGQTTDLHVDPDSKESNFSIGSPVYNLGFNVIPGVKPTLFVDLGIWKGSWGHPVWFPQLKFKLPPAGYDFDCHEDTVCEQPYTISPSGLSEGIPCKTPLACQLQNQWGTAFGKKWMPQCTDDICEFGIKLVRLNAVYEAMDGKDEKSAIDLGQLQPVFQKAEDLAANVVQYANDRKSHANASTGWAIIYQAVWSKRCSDVPCMNTIGAIASQMAEASIVAQKNNQDEGSAQIQAKVGMQFKPKYEEEIAASHARATAGRLPLQYLHFPNMIRQQ